MGLKTGRENVNCIQAGVQWQVVVNIAMNLRVS